MRRTLTYRVTAWKALVTPVPGLQARHQIDSGLIDVTLEDTTNPDNVLDLPFTHKEAPELGSIIRVTFEEDTP